jgi:hypothetical protein
MNRHFPRRTVGFLGVAAFLALASPAMAQSRVPFEQDNHAFRFVLYSLGLHPLSETRNAISKPDESIVIVFGQTAILERLGPKQFVENGGALMIATDRETKGVLEREFQLRVSGNMVEGDPDTVYRKSAECPLIRPIPDAKPALFPTRIPVASNKPSFLVPLQGRGQLTRLAEFPADCQVVLERKSGPRKFPGPFAMGGTLGKGRILVLSDHSVFINGMMLQSDNGNFDFAYNCVKWLSDSGKRHKVLFFDEGTPVDDFKVPITNVPVPPIPAMQAANHVVVALEQEDLFNKLILEQFSLRQIVSAWAVAVTVTLLLFVFYRLIRSGYHTDTQAPLLAQGAGQAGPAAPVLALRWQSLIQDGNLWEVAGDVARQWFAESGYDLALAAAPGKPVPRSIRINAGWWRRRRLQRQVSRLWRLAFQPEPERVSRRDFERLLTDVYDLRTAAEQGVVQFQQPGTTA